MRFWLLLLAANTAGAVAVGATATELVDWPRPFIHMLVVVLLLAANVPVLTRYAAVSQPAERTPALESNHGLGIFLDQVCAPGLDVRGRPPVRRWWTAPQGRHRKDPR